MAAQQIRLDKAVAAQQALIDDRAARRAAGAGSRLGRRPVDPDDAATVREARARLDELAAQASAEAEAAGSGVMLGGYACQDTGDVQQAARLEAVALKGAAVVAAAHAAHAGDPRQLAACHWRLCTSPASGGPGHDIAACHATMTGGIGTIVYDAGYRSEENITAPGADRLIATGKRHAMDTQARDHPAEGPPPDGATPAQANDWRLRTPEGRALYKRRAPDVEGLHASLEDRIGLRRFSMRGLAAVTGEFFLAGLCHNLRLLYRVS